MKRDMDLVRSILMEVESADDEMEVADLIGVPGGHSLPDIAYHVEMLAAHGLIDASVQRTKSGLVGGIISGLTWDGCDYLDAIRDDSTWQRTKKVIKDSVGSTTLSVIKEAAQIVAVSLISKALM